MFFRVLRGFSGPSVSGIEFYPPAKPVKPDLCGFWTDLGNFRDFGLLCPGILVPGFGVQKVRGPDFKRFSSLLSDSGGPFFSKMPPPQNFRGPPGSIFGSF